MGRPPIGKTAMSAAERQRRQRAALRDVTKPEELALSMTAQQKLDALQEQARKAGMRSE